MSYDLLVFAPAKAPNEREAFLSWWEETSEWSEDHSYDDPKVSTPELQAWFLEMIKSYPAMNGPFSSEEFPEDDSAVTDYSVGKEAIYAAFAWSKAEAAYEQVFSLAAKHQLGFFDASSETGAVWLPDGKGGLKLSHQGKSPDTDDSDA
jgi:hypothetical protein